jgi:hypothetical protein
MMELLKGFVLGLGTAVGVAMVMLLCYGGPAQAQLREEQLVLDGKVIPVPAEQHFVTLIKRCNDSTRVPQLYFQGVCANQVRLYRNAWDSFVQWRKLASLAEFLNRDGSKALENARAQHQLALEMEQEVKTLHSEIFRP